MENQARLAYLIKQYLDNKITISELSELTTYLHEPEYRQDQDREAKDLYLQSILAGLISSQPHNPEYNEADWDPLYQKIRQQLPSAATEEMSPAKRPARKLYWLAAASILLCLLTGAAFLLNHSRNQDRQKQDLTNRNPTIKDIGPGGNKALLTLADGTTIDLGEAKNGTIGQQDNARIVKLAGGQLAYTQGQGSSARPAPGQNPSMNRISTPKGGQFQLILPDSTKVWLNASSSLKYPTAFAGRERSVELQGEAYFEVAKDKGRPFKVVIAPEHAGTSIEVLGTSFNVKAYTDESNVRTTLLEGRVNVLRGEQTASLKPGEQADYDDNGTLKKGEADIGEAIAWKNGLFRFNEATIEEVMRQISRWYDVEVIYVNTPPKDLFRGEIYRNVSVSKVLKVLEASGVKFTVEGRKILVQS